MNVLWDLFRTFAKIGMFTFGGGYALWRDGLLIGGLGISGGSVEQDMDIALAAIAAINVGTHQ